MIVGISAGQGGAGLDEAELSGAVGGLEPVANFKLAEYMGDVRLDGTQEIGRASCRERV